MPFTHHAQHVNARLGSYFGLIAALLVALFAILLIFEQLGAPERLIRLALLVGPLVLFAAIGVTCMTGDVRQFFVAGRRVPAVHNGLILAIAAIGSVGVVTFPGLIFINGIDAWCLSIGLATGFVVMAAMIAPFLRKLGTFTLAGYFARRFESRIIGVVSAVVLGVPTMLIIIAELRMGAYVATLLTGLAQPVVIAALASAVLTSLLAGGMRGASWTGTAQGIAVMIALLVPMAMVGVLLTNMPLAQLSYGPILRGIGRLEQIEAFTTVRADLLTFSLAGQRLEPLVQRMALPFVGIGPLSYSLTTLVVMAGIAAAPWLLARAGTTPSVYHARKSIGWAILFAGILLTGLSASAVFLRDYVMSELVGRPVDALPGWIRELEQLGLARVESGAVRLKIEAFSFRRDGVLLALPLAAGFASAVVYAALVGAVAASLAALSASIQALATSISEDLLFAGGRASTAPAHRLLAARAAMFAVVGIGAWLAMSSRVDPLHMALAALSLTASAVFPVLVASIWWKRVTWQGALAGMITGFAVTVALLLAPDGTAFGVPRLLAGAVGMPLALMAVMIVTVLSPLPRRALLEVVRDMRVPGGEAVHDREIRLRRLQEH